MTFYNTVCTALLQASFYVRLHFFLLLATQVLIHLSQVIRLFVRFAHNNHNNNNKCPSLLNKPVKS